MRDRSNGPSTMHNTLAASESELEPRNSGMAMAVLIMQEGNSIGPRKALQFQVRRGHRVGLPPPDRTGTPAFSQTKSQVMNNNEEL